VAAARALISDGRVAVGTCKNRFPALRITMQTRYTSIGYAAARAPNGGAAVNRYTVENRDKPMGPLGPLLSTIMVAMAGVALGRRLERRRRHQSEDAPRSDETQAPVIDAEADPATGIYRQKQERRFRV